MEVHYYEPPPVEPEVKVVIEMSMEERQGIVHEMEVWMVSRGLENGYLKQFYHKLNVGIKSTEIRNSLHFGMEE